jgi:hypothetical protein
VTLTVFGQLLAGEVLGGESGVMRSTGGFATQPGVGVDIGAGGFAIRAQFDARHVRDSVVEDSRLAVPQFATLSGRRLTVGLTWRFMAR